MVIGFNYLALYVLYYAYHFPAVMTLVERDLTTRSLYCQVYLSARNRLLSPLFLPF